MPPKRRRVSRAGLRTVQSQLGSNSMLTRGRPLSPMEVEDHTARSAQTAGSIDFGSQHVGLAGEGLRPTTVQAHKPSELEPNAPIPVAGDEGDAEGDDDDTDEHHDGYEGDDDDNFIDKSHNNNDSSSGDSSEEEPDASCCAAGLSNSSFGSAQESHGSEITRARGAALEYAKTQRAEDSSRGKGWKPKPSEASGAICNLSASDFLALALWCGPGHLSGRQYESTRSAVESSVKTALSPCVENVAEFSRQSLLKRLADDGVIEVYAIDEAHRIALQEMPDVDKDSLDVFKTTATTLTALPSLATMRRRMKCGGLYEKLMLSSRVIRMERKVKTRAAKSVPATSEPQPANVRREDAAAGKFDNVHGNGEAATQQNVGEAALQHEQNWKTPATAGVVLPSTYIARDFAFMETFFAIMSGVKGTKYWVDAPAGSPTQFSCTDLATRPHSVLRPGAYGAEAPAGGHRWPDLFCEGSKLEISAIGIDENDTPTKSKTLIVNVTAVKQPFIHSNSGCDETIADTSHSMSNEAIRCKYGAKVRPGDVIWEVVGIGTSDAGAVDSSEETVGEFAALLFHWGEVRMRATLLWKGDVWCVESSKCIERPVAWDPGTLAPSSAVRDEAESVMSWTGLDGTKCIRIHIAIFSDDFNVRPNKSVGGVYMLYLTMPTERRSGAQATRIISVSPIGGNSDVCLTASLHDLLRLEMNGVLCLDPYGENVRVFARVSLALADYVQIGHSTPCKGHNSLHPCTVCSQYRGDFGSAGFQSGRSSSADLSLLRSEDRYKAIVASAPLQLEKTWGSVSIRGDMVSRTIDEALHDSVKAKKTCKDRDGFYYRQAPFLPPMSVYSAGVGSHIFDVYLSYYGGLDHCLFLGIGKDTLDFVISSMQTVSAREDFEAITLRLLLSNGYDRPGKLLSSGAKAESPTTSMTVSELSAALCFLPAALSELCDPTRDTGKTPYTNRVLPYILRHVKATISLLTCVFCPARPDISTSPELIMHQRRVSFCREAAQELIDSARAARNSAIARFSDIEAKKLQKPNLHRVMEIMVRWLPSVGWNFAHLGELLFEKTHGFMKIAFSQTQPGVDEALRAMDRMRYRELVDRLLLEYTPDISMIAGYPARDLVLSADVRKDPRVLAFLQRLQNSGSRGFTVTRDCQVWNATASKGVLDLGSHFPAEYLTSLDAIRNELDERLPVLSEDDALRILASSARINNTSVPHKSVAIGQVVTTLRRDPTLSVLEFSALAEARLTLIIDSIATWVNYEGTKVVLCHGQVLVDMSSTQNKFGLRIMKKSPERVWVQLDGSSRRAAATVATADGQVTPGIISDARVAYLAVLLPGDGFPLRLA